MGDLVGPVSIFLEQSIFNIFWWPFQLTAFIYFLLDTMGMNDVGFGLTRSGFEL